MSIPNEKLQLDYSHVPQFLNWRMWGFFVKQRFFLSSTALSASLETFSRVYLWLTDFSWDLKGSFLGETYLFLLRNFICEIYPLQCYNLTENSFYKRNEFIWTLKFGDWKYFCDTWVGFALMCWFKGILNLQRHFCFCLLLLKFRDIWRSNIIF